MIDILPQIGATKLALAIALAGTVWVVQQRVKRPAVVHNLWLMVLGAMLVPAVVPLRVLPEEVSVEVVGRSEVAAPSGIAPLRPPPEDVAEEVVVQSEVDPPVVVADAGVSSDGMAPWSWLVRNGKPLTALLWFLGSAGFFAWTVARTVRFHRMLTRAARPAPQLQRLATQVGDALDLPRVPGVYTATARLRPLVWWAGGRVRILIPSVFLDELDETELRAVLAHELAHVRRRDYLVRLVELLACSAYWWNPVVWWAKRRMRSAEESSCDVLAVSASRLTRDRYAKALLRVVEIMSAVPIPRAPAMASTAGSCRDSRRLERRLRTVMATPAASSRAGGVRVAGLVALGLGLTLGLVYCTPGEQLEAGLKPHPTEENALPPDAIALTDDPEPPGLVGRRLERWRTARERLMGARTVAAVGSNEEGPGLFGEIADAKVDESGNLVVLDEQAASVRVFGPDGSYLHGFGRVGEGPLEMVQPRGLELLGTDRLAVYHSFEAKVFSRRQDEWQLDSIASVPTVVEDNCAFPDRFFHQGTSHMSTNQRPDAVRVLDDYTLFYEVGSLGDPPRVTYGGAYRDASWLIRHHLSTGRIACVPAASRVIYAFQIRPLVRSYSAATGEVDWSAYVENYVQIRLEEEPEGGFRLYGGLANDHLVTTLAMPSGHIVLQYRRVGYLREFEAIRTFLLDAETGHGSLVSEALPRIESFHEGGYVASFEDPYPRLEIRALVQ